jgi:hypothetical protein
MEFDGFAWWTPASEKPIESDKDLPKNYSSNLWNANYADDMVMPCSW